MPQPPRLDLYAPIHKALRLFMHDTLTRLGAADVHDPDELIGALAQLHELLGLLRSHLDHENQFMHPAIEAAQPGATGAGAADHLEHLAAIDGLQAEARALPAAPPVERDAAAMRLYRHLALFVAENLRHMQHEESRHNQLLWQHYDDGALAALHESILATVGPAEMALVMRWMAPALAHGELAGMLGGMRTKMPAEAFRGVLAVVQSQLPPLRRAKLQRSLAWFGG